VVAFVLSILLALRFPPPPRRYRTGGARLHTELAVLQRKLLRRPRTPSIGSFGPPSVASGRTGRRGRPGRSRRPSWLGIVRVSAGIGALSRQRRAAPDHWGKSCSDPAVGSREPGLGVSKIHGNCIRWVSSFQKGASSVLSSRTDDQILHGNVTRCPRADWIRATAARSLSGRLPISYI
jgi:hypothetical protein